MVVCHSRTSKLICNSVPTIQVETILPLPLQFQIVYSAIKKNTFESVLMRWMKLKPIIQSEVSQKEKHQYSILTHIYMKFREMITMTLYERQRKRHRYKEETFGLCGRR